MIRIISHNQHGDLRIHSGDHIYEYGGVDSRTVHNIKNMVKYGCEGQAWRMLRKCRLFSKDGQRLA